MSSNTTNTTNTANTANTSMFICPITREFFVHPVMAEDGHMYEREAIELWYKTNDTSPISRQKIDRKILIKNIIFNNMLDEFYKNNPEHVPFNIDILIKIIHDESYDSQNIMKYLQTINEFYGNKTENMVHTNSNDYYVKSLSSIFNNEKFISFLISHMTNMSNISYEFAFGDKLIHLICQFGTLNVIKMIIDNPNINLEAQNGDQCAPIHFICSGDTILSNENQLNAIKMLVEKNINLEIKNNNGWRPLHYVCSRSTNLTNKHQLNAIILLVEKGVDIEAPVDDSARPIHFLCSNWNNMKDNNQLKAIKLLADRGVALNSMLKNTCFPINLIFGVKAKYESTHILSLIKLLIKYNTNLEIQDNVGERLIHYICNNNSFKNKHKLAAIKILINRGINLDSETKNKNRPIHLLLSCENSSDDKDKMNIIKLFIKHGVNLDAQNNDGKRPIHYLCNKNKKIFKDDQYRIAVIKLLIIHNVNLKDVVLKF